jgi:AAA domain
MTLQALDDAIKVAGGPRAVVKRGLRSWADEERPGTRQLDYVMADSLSDDDDQFDDELIEGTLGRGAMGVLYGDSNSGKTFCAIDMGAAVAMGSDWLGRPTDRGLVVYLATESPASVEMRLKAYQRHHQLRVPGFVIVRSPINLYDGQADTTAVIALVDELERQHGTKVALIIGDTLARLVVGANENAGEDMGVVVRNIDTIRSATRAAFVAIHHTGKDAARGMRGWSGLRAATDTEIEVTSEEASGLRTAEITKQRDLPGKGDRVGFRLIPVHLGVNRWGTDRSSCVVAAADAPAKAQRGKRQSEVAGAITEFLRARGAGCLRGALAAHFKETYARQSVYREINKMLDAGLLIEAAGLVALPGKPGAAN